MKKIFTILLAAGSVTFASAQSSHNNGWNHDEKGNSRDVILGKTGSSIHDNNVGMHGSYSFDREKDQQIKDINRKFDQKIEAVKWNRHLRPGAKNWQIRMLERQRKEQIKEVQMRYEDSRRHDDHFDNHKW